MPKTKKKVPNWDTVVKTKVRTSSSTPPKNIKSPKGISYNKWIRGSPMTPPIKVNNNKTPTKKSKTKKGILETLKTRLFR